MTAGRGRKLREEDIMPVIIKQPQKLLDRCIIIQPARGANRVSCLLPKGTDIPKGFIQVLKLDRKPVFAEGKLHSRHDNLPMYREELYCEN